MSSAFGYLLLLLVAVSFNPGHAMVVSSNASHEGKLLFSHVIFRHGARTPVSTYPTDPYCEPEYWETGWGQLINDGKRSQFQLGLWLRQRYGTLLNTLYHASDICIQSSELDRTIMSAETTLAGLYPPSGSDVWNERLAWQPIPVHSIPLRDDNLIAMVKPCARHVLEMKLFMANEEYQAFNDSLASLYAKLTAQSGSAIFTPFSMYKLYDCWRVEDHYNLTLPAWTEEFYTDDRMIEALKIRTATPQLARLKAGFLLKTILSRLREKVNGTLQPDRSLWIYSGHDFTIANLLNAMGMFQLQYPPFSSCLLIEMRECGSDGGCVSVFYKNGEADPEPMIIPGCGILCPLGRMFELYNDILPDDWEEECNLQDMAGGSFDLEPLSDVL